MAPRSRPSYYQASQKSERVVKGKLVHMHEADKIYEWPVSAASYGTFIFTAPSLALSF